VSLLSAVSTREMFLRTPVDRDEILGIHMSLVNATTTPRLLRLVESGMLEIGSLVTHRTFPPVSFALSFVSTSQCAQYALITVVSVEWIVWLGAVLACAFASISHFSPT
jgi:hypothetical protein